MQTISNFIESLPTWYLLLVIYLLFTIPSLIYLNKRFKEEEKNDENNEIKFDIVYLYVSALFHPLFIFFSLLAKFIPTLVEIVYSIVNFILGIILLIFAGILYLITLPFNLISKKKGKNKNERKDESND